MMRWGTRVGVCKGEEPSESRVSGEGARSRDASGISFPS